MTSPLRRNHPTTASSRRWLARRVEIRADVARRPGSVRISICLLAAFFAFPDLPIGAKADDPPKKFTPPVHARPIRNTLRERAQGAEARDQRAQPRLDPEVRTISAVAQDDGQWRQRGQGVSVSDPVVDELQLQAPAQGSPYDSDPPPPPKMAHDRSPDGPYGRSVLSDDLASPRLNRPPPAAQNRPLADQYAMPSLRSQHYQQEQNDLRGSGQFAGQAMQAADQGDLTCDQARQYLLDNSLRDVTTGTAWQLVEDPPGSNQLVWKKDTRLDITNISPNPPDAVGKMGEARPIVWKDRLGRDLVTGKLVDFYRNYVVVEDAQGRRHKIPFIELGDESLGATPGALASVWNLPKECTIGSYQYQERLWIPQTVTWTASALCHKPLYFEDINLERYGHTSGPISQPVLSTAHFFVNLAALPYKMGINPPNECQYALGYYRPGDCAPWLVHPIPISLKGALYTGLVYTGAVYILP